MRGVPPLDPERSRALWRAAASFGDLCELGARFAEGAIEHFPGWGWPRLDAESLELEADLALLNRSGLLTTCSQPGRADDAREFAQRAFVSGFATATCIERLRAIERRPGLHFLVQEPDALPGADLGECVPVTLERGLARVELGGPAHAAEVACFEDDLRPELLALLARTPIVTAWDERWGPSTALWSELRALLREDADRR
ncbi:MAG: hypothetical protein IPJ77_02670 [Planctomycetes bacterium]|nr:hypothetical protein [Planctomycetota bacterium]